jgi:hypothetical protein
VLTSLSDPTALLDPHQQQALAQGLSRGQGPAGPGVKGMECRLSFLRGDGGSVPCQVRAPVDLLLAIPSRSEPFQRPVGPGFGARLA